MSQPITEPLILDLVEWVAAAPRPYAEVLDAWRTSCPRLTVWEDALDRGLVACTRREADGAREPSAVEIERHLAASASPNPWNPMLARG